MDAPLAEKHLWSREEEAPPATLLSPTRAVGIGLLCACAFALLKLYASVALGPRHPPSLAEMLLSFAAVLTGLGGAMTTIIGTALFRSHPRPPRARPRGGRHLF